MNIVPKLLVDVESRVVTVEDLERAREALSQSRKVVNLILIVLSIPVLLLMVSSFNPQYWVIHTAILPVLMMAVYSRFGLRSTAVVALVSFIITSLAVSAFSNMPDNYYLIAHILPVSVIACPWAMGTFIDSYVDREICSANHRLTPISEELAPEILKLCCGHEELAKYQGRVAGQGRTLVYAEYLAMRQWVDTLTDRANGKKLHAEQQQAFQALRMPVAR